VFPAFLIGALTDAVRSQGGTWASHAHAGQAERATPETVGRIVVLVQGRHELFRWLLARVTGDDAWEPAFPAAAAMARLTAELCEHFLRLRLVGGVSYKPRVRRLSYTVTTLANSRVGEDVQTKVAIPSDYLLRVDRAELVRLADWAAVCPTTPVCAGDARGCACLLLSASDPTDT
jgi:hypothetical protein